MLFARLKRGLEKKGGGAGSHRFVGPAKTKISAA